ncbi:MAG: S8 family serine peptidase [Candidatus Sumerlaeota bacterium]|nr:S8 family serine peptidase [Candidatus Sumerlaeota bacterium]
MIAQGRFHNDVSRMCAIPLGKRIAILHALLACLLMAGIAMGQAAPGKYAYICQGKSIELSPSGALVAVGESPALSPQMIQSSNLAPYAHPNNPSLKARRMTVYQRAASNQGAAPASALALAQTLGAEYQPVFEQGMSLLIPADEVIVGFPGPTAAGAAGAILAPRRNELGITALRQSRATSCIVTINNPSNGRCYDVARALAQTPGVAFAEPNHIVIFLGLNADPLKEQRKFLTFAGDLLKVGPPQPAPLAAQPALASAPVWTTLASLDCESATLPTGWTLGVSTGKTDAKWGRTALKKHGGSYSYYCAQDGTASAAAPGPAPTNMTTFLDSPEMNLSGYGEVYVEIWFYAKNEINAAANPIFVDSGSCAVWNLATAGLIAGQYLGVSYTGDCTVDPTTANGWRKLTIRIPDNGRVARAVVEIQWFSNATAQTEGLYIDDVRVVGTANIDSEHVTNDPYGGRKWDIKNVGQIAGYGNDNNDLHAPEAWALTPVSSSVVVAVIDCGVDLTHPDLNLVTGYNPDGAVGGGPQTADDNHGTACAGEVGALANNNKGAMGLAPGVKIMPIYNGDTYAKIATTLDLAVQHGANILSNSWGWVGAPSTEITNSVSAALTANKIVLFAAGNGPDRSPWTYEVAFPGSLTGSTDVICVGASSLTDEHKSASSSDGIYSWGSSYIGDGPDVVAPGPWSYTTDRQGAVGYSDGTVFVNADYTESFGGTSSATPKTAGIVALMLSVNPTLTPAQVKSLLRSSADDIDAAGVDDKTGAGRVNALKAVQAAQSGTTAPWIRISPTTLQFP